MLNMATPHGPTGSAGASDGGQVTMFSSPIFTSTRKTVEVDAPPGYLGLDFIIWFDILAGQRFIQVDHVDPDGPLHGKVLVGDRITAVNGVDTVDHDKSYIEGILAGLSQMPCRSLKILRERSANAVTVPIAPSPMTTPATSTSTARDDIDQSPNFQTVVDSSNHHKKSTSKEKENVTPAAANANQTNPIASTSATNAVKKKTPPQVTPQVAPKAVPQGAPFNHGRRPIVVHVPTGKLGLTLGTGVKDCPFVKIIGVDPSRPLAMYVRQGDWISHVNGQSVIGLGMNTVLELLSSSLSNTECHYRSLAALPDNHRTLTILTDRGNKSINSSATQPQPQPPPQASPQMKPFNHGRRSFVVYIPKTGKLGLEIYPGSQDCPFVKIHKVYPSSPLANLVRQGDWISHVNEHSVIGLDFKTFQEILSSPPYETESRSLTILTGMRSTTRPQLQPQRARSHQEYNLGTHNHGESSPTTEASNTYRAPTPTASTSLVTRGPPLASEHTSKIEQDNNLANQNHWASALTAAAINNHQASTTSNLLLKRGPQLPSERPAKRKRGQPVGRKPVPYELPDTYPDRGPVCENKFYCTKNNETLGQVAEKLGTDWRSLAAIKCNTAWYGNLTGSSLFKADTLLRIPENCSKWKVQQLQKPEFSDAMIELEECMDCGLSTRPAEMLVCDGCDAPHHTSCVGLHAVPNGDWFCVSCLDILRARREKGDIKRRVFSLPLVPALETVLSTEERDHITSLRAKLNEYLDTRCRQDLQASKDLSLASQQTLQQLEQELQAEIIRLEAETKDAKQKQEMALKASMSQHEVVKYECNSSESAHGQFIQLRQNGQLVSLKKNEEKRGVKWDGYRYRMTYSDQWNTAREIIDRVTGDPQVVPFTTKLASLEQELATVKLNREQANQYLDGVDDSNRAKDRQICLEYAALLQKPRLDFEMLCEFVVRCSPPRYLGQISVESDDDVTSLFMLREPDELIILVPLQDQEDFEPQIGRQYGVFARQELFDKKRDDGLPMEKNGVRNAQRQLFRLLESQSGDVNKYFVVSRPFTPPTVRPRVGPADSGCFDLNELVRDCNVALDLPREPTPASMVSRGLAVRDYQEQSLRWLLDKENEPTGLGIAGELWYRLRFLDPSLPSHDDYFYCEVTGSFALNIFEFKKDVGQSDASDNRFQMPTGGVLADEMGMGKTAVVIALILLNRPPLHRRVLPREHLWSLEKFFFIDHAEYFPRPQFGSNDSLSKSNLLSNGTLVIVPMTLLSQWKSELERFAPELSVTVLHSAENPTVQAVASADVVIASTVIFQQHSGGRTSNVASILQMIKKIHWHRICVDEAHQHKHDHALTKFVGVLSATNRISITGTPIGSKLGDVQGQMRMLRVAPFDRPDFWKNNLDEPYADHNVESLGVLRALLSHLVCRHSKEQTHANGQALLALPPRTVETVLLKFGSDSEQKCYDILESNIRRMFRRLRGEAKANVHESFYHLNALVLAARQVACHVSLVNLDKLHRNNKEVEYRKMVALGGDSFSRPELSEVGATTRAEVFKLAVSRARPGAQQRMLEALNKWQKSGNFLECPVCLDVQAEVDLALAPCAHPICSDCVLSLLTAGTRYREPTGHCPTCRDTMLRSEITFLGDAEDAGTSSSAGTAPAESELDKKMPATVQNTALPSFSFTSSVVQASVTGASTVRTNRSNTTERDIAQQVEESRADLPTLEASFLSSYFRSELNVGSKVARLLQEVDAMIEKDSLSKCVVFSQFQGVLDIVDAELSARKIGRARIDGNCKQHHRADALLEFSSNPDTKVFLLTMNAGATGLTLTSADHCFILDVAQNSDIEEQAIDRCHRM